MVHLNGFLTLFSRDFLSLVRGWMGGNAPGKLFVGVFGRPARKKALALYKRCAPFLPRSSAASLPTTPTCPGTY